MLGHTEAFKKLGDANYTYTRSLLAQLGYNESNKLTFELWYESSGHYPSSADQALLYKEALEDSGVISVTLKSASWANYKSNRDSEIMDAYVYGWYPDYVDPDNYAFLYWAGWLHTNYSNATQVALYDQARATANQTLRTELYAQIDGMAVEQCSVVPLYVSGAWAVTKPTIGGIYLDITQDMRYWLLYIAEAEPKTWTVDDDGPADFHTIQEAINAASDEDTIFVYNGTYYENVVVNKTVLLIGENRSTTIIDANGIDNVVDVKADGVVIEGFVIQNSGYDASGVHIGDYAHVTIRNNTIINNDLAGIDVWDSWYNSISENNITNNYYGIVLQYSSENTLRNNHMSDNKRNFFICGDIPNYFYHDVDSSNTVDDKPMCYWLDQHNRSVPSDAGYVALIYSSNITVQNLDLNNNSQGVLLVQTENSIIRGNTITNNRWSVYLLFSSNNTVSENSIVNSGFGIYLSDSSNNTIYGNSVANNYFGIDLSYRYVPSTNNTIYHNNFVNNTEQVIMSAHPSYANFWDNGYPSGGNYWSNYTGVDVKSGFYQNETDSDGIGDMTHTIDANNTDHYPLMAPINFFDAGTWNGTTYYVDIVSNSTLSHFYFNPDEGTFAHFWVKGETETETFGFCRVAIPKSLMWVEDGWTVLYGSYPLSYKTFSDENYTYLYFTYTNPPSGFTTITINGAHAIPEFPSFLFLPLFIVATLLTAITFRRKRAVQD
jgi:parallel beta-helix repeat protein